MVFVFSTTFNTTRFTAAAVVDDVSNPLVNYIARAHVGLTFRGIGGMTGLGTGFSVSHRPARAPPVVALAVPTTVPGPLQRPHLSLAGSAQRKQRRHRLRSLGQPLAAVRARLGSLRLAASISRPVSSGTRITASTAPLRILAIFSKAAASELQARCCRCERGLREAWCVSERNRASSDRYALYSNRSYPQRETRAATARRC